MKLANKLDLDNPTLVSEHGSWKYAKNIQLSEKGDYSENEDKLVTSSSFTQTLNYTYLGKIIIPDDIILFHYQQRDGQQSFLQISKESTGIVNRIRIADERYKHQEIHGTYDYNHKGELIITFGCRSTDDNVPELLIINYDKRKGTITYPNTEEYNSILLNPNYFRLKPVINLKDVDKGGMLETGTYFVSMCYEDEDGNRSDFTPLSNPILVNDAKVVLPEPTSDDLKDDLGRPPRPSRPPTFSSKINSLSRSGNQSSKSITLQLSNLDNTWKYIRFAVIFYKDLTIAQIKLTNKIDNNLTEYTITSIDGLSNYTLEGIIINNTKYTHCKTMTSNSNSLLLYNLKTDKVFFETLQEVSNNVKISYHTTKRMNIGTNYTSAVDTVNTYLDSNAAYYDKPFKYGETYCFYIGYEYVKGGYISINPIPNKGDTNLSEYAISKLYPDGFGSVEGQPITFHKFPEFKDVNTDIENTKVDNLLALKLLGINIENVIIPDEIKNICSGWRIFYAERTTSNITRLGTLHSFAPPPDGLEGTEIGDYYFGPRIPVGGTVPNYGDINFVNPRLSAYSMSLQYSNIPVSLIAGFRQQLKYKHIQVGSITPPRYNTNFIINSTLEDSTDNSFHTREFKYVSGIDRGINDKIYFNSSLPKGLYEIITVNDGGDIYSDIFNQTLVNTGISEEKNKTNSLNKYGGDVYLSRHWVDEYEIDELGDGTKENPTTYKTRNIYLCFEESVYNLENRHEGKNDYEKLVFQSTVGRNRPHNGGSYINDDFGNSYDQTYSKINNIENPAVFEKELDNIFKNRIAISDVNQSESTRLGWRIFRPNNYYDVAFNRGEGFKLISVDKQLYIQNTYGLFLAQIKDVLQLADGSQAWLGTGDLFDRPPQELMYKESGGIGCKDYHSAIFTEFGYVVCDRDHDAIYIITDSVQDITNSNFKLWFKENNTSNENDLINIGFDRDRKRLLINNKDSYVMSYNILSQGLTSFHDYNYIDIAVNRKGTFLIHNKSVDKFTKQPTNLPSYIDVNIVVEPNVQKIFQAVIWETQYELGKHKLWDKTIDKLMVYNDTQCTGMLDVNVNQMWYDSKTGTHKADQWIFNKLLDAVINDREPFLDNFMPNDNVALNRKNWFDMSQFICKFVTVRLYSNNNNNQRVKFLNLYVEISKDAR